MAVFWSLVLIPLKYPGGFGINISINLVITVSKLSGSALIFTSRDMLVRGFA